jgi:hypothetical protein
VARSILPDLDVITFKGTSEYLDDLVTQIDAPRLNYLFITFIYQMTFNTPHLVEFISRTPRFQEPNEAHLNLNPDARVQLVWASSESTGRLWVELSTSWDEEVSQPQLSTIAQVFTMCLPPLPTVENLRLEVFHVQYLNSVDWISDVDQWLEFLRPFTAVKSLYISEKFQPNIALALQELIGDRTTEVLPSLQNIFLRSFDPPSQEAIGQFVSARQLSGHPIAVLPVG